MTSLIKNKLSDIDSYYMDQVIKLANKGTHSASPNPLVGCLIVKNNQIIAKGFHKQVGSEHAEIKALKNLKTESKNATMYVNLEPCSHHGNTPPCIDAIIKAKIKKVVIGMQDPDKRVNGKGIRLLKKAKINVVVGVNEKACRYLNRGFIKRNTKSLPWVHLKTATTLDGKIAQTDGTSKWITSKESRFVVQKLRAAACAILTTSTTAIADNPRLNVRDIKTPRQPKLFLIDRKLKCPLNLKLLKSNLVIFTSKTNAKKNYPKNNTLVGINNITNAKGLTEILKYMANEYLINNLLIEAGGTFTASLLKNNLVDEITGFIAPKYLGEGISVANLNSYKLNNAPSYKLNNCQVIGNDMQFNLLKNYE